MTTTHDTTYTRDEAAAYVRQCGETDGPDGDPETLHALFRALYEREPDNEDADLWDLICAAVNEED